MNRGGVETWLMHVLRNVDRRELEMDFLVHTERPCAYDDEIRALGARIIPCPDPRRPVRYARRFKVALREFGPYDVIHSHVHEFSGMVLKLAHAAGITGRIAHSHTDRAAAQSKDGVLRRLYSKTMRRWIDRHATAGIGVSEQAAASLFGTDWRNDPRWRVLYYGIDFSPYARPVDRDVTRQELGIPADAMVIGHVGNLLPVKNHAWLFKVAAEVSKRVASLRVLCIGGGPLRDSLEAQARELGLGDKVTFTGPRPDVWRLLKGVVDVFVFPSHYEGLGIVALEAQSAGLPVVVSDVLPREIDVVPGAVTRLSLSAPASDWADACIAAYAKRPAIDQRQNLARLERSRFNLEGCVGALRRLYAGDSNAVDLESAAAAEGCAL
jgi:glycosyltransferase involved in cell wall biosynthesis